MPVSATKLSFMSNKWGRIAAGVGALTATGLLVAGGVAFFAPAAAEPEPVAVVSTYTTETVATVDYLDAARADKAAREAEAARIAAEKKAAAEKAAAEAEAQRIAEEQAAAEQAAAEAEEWVEEPTYEEPAVEEPEAPTTDLVPLPWVDAGNGTGYWDTSGCPTGSGMTGPDGGQYCYTG